MFTKFLTKLLPQKKSEPRQEPTTLFIGFALITMMSFAIALSLLVFSKTSLRLDEAQSLFQTNRDVPGMLKLVAQDVHVPGYHLLLHFWQKILGGDIVIARFMSLFFFVLTIPATYALARYAFTARIGLYAALLVAISPFMNWYASEARMYSMLAFFTVLHQYFFLKVYREGTPRHWLGYTLTAIAGIYTHYFFAFVLITEALFYLFRRTSFSSQKVFLKFTFAAAVVIGAIAPWLYYVYSLGSASNTQPFLETPSSQDLFNTYAQFIFGFQIDYLNTIIISMWPIVVLLAFFALQKSRKTPPEAFYFVMAAVVPVVAAFVLSVTIRPFYLSRYLIVSLPALIVFLAWAFSNYPKRLSLVLKSILVALISVTMVIQVVSPETPVKENYIDAVEYVSKNASSQDVIIAAAPFTIYPIEYYYKGNAKLTTQPTWDRFSQGSVPAFDQQKVAEQTKQITGPYQKAWLILSFDQGYNDDLREYYDRNFEKVAQKTFSPNLTIYTYKIRYDDPIRLSN